MTSHTATTATATSLYKNNLLNSSESELYHANSAASSDNNSAYDPLNRLTAFERGTLSSSGNNGSTLDTVASASGSQSWNLNAVGDQSSVTTNGTTATNSANAKNELTANGSSSLVFDHNGNTLTDENGQTYTYDAWNRSITVKNSSGTTIASYSYDPTGRRVTESAGGITTNVYFTNQWQAIEERQGGTVTRQNVWGLGYVNQLVVRDDNSISGTLGITGSGLGKRLYAEQDANWNVTSLIDTGGNVVERMTYLSYGAVTFLTASWSPTADAYVQNVLFEGGRLETATGNYVFDNRDEDSTTGTWKEADPAKYVDGANRYLANEANPLNRIDPLGLRAVPSPDPSINKRWLEWLQQEAKREQAMADLRITATEQDEKTHCSAVELFAHWAFGNGMFLHVALDVKLNGQTTRIELLDANSGGYYSNGKAVAGTDKVGRGPAGLFTVPLGLTVPMSANNSTVNTLKTPAGPAEAYGLYIVPDSSVLASWAGEAAADPNDAAGAQVREATPILPMGSDTPQSRKAGSVDSFRGPFRGWQVERAYRLRRADS